MKTDSPSRLQALRRGLCPACRRGAIFAGRWRMNESCPVCHVRFERAPGYFVGAMIISYALASIPVAALLLVFQLSVFRAWPLWRLLAIAGVTYAALVPVLVRWSRILWIHLGHRAGW
jgi:uncharacterized protein (DUF983 family)